MFSAKFCDGFCQRGLACHEGKPRDVSKNVDKILAVLAHLLQIRPQSPRDYWPLLWFTNLLKWKDVYDVPKSLESCLSLARRGALMLFFFPAESLVCRSARTVNE